VKREREKCGGGEGANKEEEKTGRKEV